VLCKLVLTIAFAFAFAFAFAYVDVDVDVDVDVGEQLLFKQSYLKRRSLFQGINSMTSSLSVISWLSIF
jgi:hypothetical protein